MSYLQGIAEHVSSALTPCLLCDGDKKFKAYKANESLREYLLISLKAKFAMLYTNDDAKFWVHSENDGGKIFRMETLD